MRMNYSRYRGTWVWRVEGSLEEVDVPCFRRALAALPAGSAVVFDLAQLDRVSSAGLGALIGAVRRCREAGGDAVLCRPTTAVDKTLRSTLVPRFAPVAATLDEAMSRLRSRRAA